MDCSRELISVSALPWLPSIASSSAVKTEGTGWGYSSVMVFASHVEGPGFNPSSAKKEGRRKQRKETMIVDTWGLWVIDTSTIFGECEAQRSTEHP